MSRLPVRVQDWRLIVRTVRLVLGIPRYAVLTVVSAGLALSLFVFSQNLTFVSFVLTGPLSIANRLTALIELFPFIGTSYGPLTGAVLVLVSLFTGANIALITYHFAEHDFSVRAGGTGTIAVGLAVLGAGCAACGSAVLAGLLGVAGATGVLTALPFEGLEFTVLALGLLVVSMHWLVRGLRGGQIRGCPVEVD